MTNQLLNIVLIAVALNLVLPIIFKPFTTRNEMKPPKGVNNLSYKGQFMHMMYHHNQTKLMSSLIIALIVGLSFELSKLI